MPLLRPVPDLTHVARYDRANVFTEPQTGPFLDRGGAVHNLKAYGAVGDGVTDDTAAIQAWYAAIPMGETGLIPPGQYRITQPLLWDRRVNIEGAGVGSAIMPDLGSAVLDGVTVNSPLAQNSFRYSFRNFSIISNAVNACRHGIVFNFVCQGDIDVIAYTAAAGYGVVLAGCLESHIRVVGGVNEVAQYQYPGAAPTTGWVLVSQDPSGVPCNANEIDVRVAGGGRGLYIDDMATEGNNLYTGTIQACADPVTCFNSSGATFAYLHLEACTGPMRFEDCSRIQLGPSVRAVEEEVVLAGNTTAMILDGIICDSLTIEPTCDRIFIGKGFFHVNGVADSGGRAQWVIASRQGSVSAPNATTTTLFSAAGKPGRYTVSAFSPNTAAAYHGVADFIFDGAAFSRVQGTNGALLTLTASGTDVQATQTSGTTLAIAYVYTYVPYT
jgi:hypothetical protein